MDIEHMGVYAGAGPDALRFRENADVDHVNDCARCERIAIIPYGGGARGAVRTARLRLTPERQPRSMSGI